MADYHRMVDSPWKEAFVYVGAVTSDGTPSIRAFARLTEERNPTDGLNATQVRNAALGTEGRPVGDKTIDQITDVLTAYIEQLPGETRPPRDVVVDWCGRNRKVKKALSADEDTLIEWYRHLDPASRQRLIDQAQQELRHRN